jgi:hypothetical protein
MSITVWAAPAFRLKSRHVLRFLTESRSPIRAVEVRLFSSDTLYSRTPAGWRRWESVGDLAKTAEDISKYIGDSGSPLATIIWESVGDLAKTAEDISKYIGDSGSPLATIITDELTRPPS